MKRILLLCICLTIALLVSACANSNIQSESMSSSIITDDNHQTAIQSSSEESSQNDKSQTELSVEEYSKVLNKWNDLGGTSAFKNIDDLDTKTAVAIYSNFVMNQGRIPSGMSEDWLEIEGFDSFIQNYFNVDPELFHQDYPSDIGNGYNPDKGFRFNQHSSVLPTDTIYELLDYGLNEDSTHFIKFKTTIELPNELFPVGENISVHTTTITFKYINGEAYFLKAEYQ